MQASHVLDQLNALRDHHPDAPLVVFVPRTQIGNAIESDLARRREGWQDLQAVIPRNYAKEIARLDILTSGQKEVPVSASLFRAARIIQELPEEERSASLPGWHRLASTVADTIGTLREEDVSIGAVRERADGTDSSDTLNVVASCYRSYTQELEEEELFDDATVYRWATERLQSETPPGISETVYAVPGAVELSEHAFQFLRELQKEGHSFAQLGITDQSQPPLQTAADRFEDDSVLGGRLSSNGEEGLKTGNSNGAPESDALSSEDRFIRAVGARSEVRAVFRSILEGEVAFEDVTIAYADSRPYATLLADEAERIGIPLTIGTGLPAEHTRTGRALRDLYKWVREDYDPAILVRMLRSGLLRTDRWLRHLRKDEQPSDPPSELRQSVSQRNEGEDLGVEEWPPGLSFRPHKAATLLAERSYESGRRSLLSGLSAAIEEIKSDSLKREDSLPPRKEDRLHRLALLKQYVDDLLDLIPKKDEDVREMARNCRTFLQRFGPTDAPDKDEKDRTADEAARGVLYDRLEKLSNTDVACRAKAPRLAALLQQWLEGQYVQGESPRPGHVHVLPLKSAGYSDRSRLHVVGLDSTTFSAPRPGSGMLQETDRQALVPSLDQGGDRSHQRTHADEELWHATRALRRHKGQTCYYTRVFDIEAGEERDPSSLFLQAERARGSATEEETSVKEENANSKSKSVVGLVPPRDAAPLSEGEQWLQVLRFGEEGSQSGSSVLDESMSVRDLLRDRYSWVLQGETARQARRSGEYTVHDGLLPNGAYPELRIFGENGSPLSASRLETLAEAPYIYFLKYVLGVRPLDEQALDDEPWFNRLRKGTLLHEIYEKFVGEVSRPVTTEDESLLDDIVEEVLKEEMKTSSPPSEVIEKAAKRKLMQNAALFLRAEIDQDERHKPEKLELGFGFPLHRQEAQDLEQAAELSVGDNSLLLRGRIDRLDRNQDTDALVAWDYKTGKASSYNEDEPLQDGKTLQWALYAYAVEALLDETVGESGYFFANVKEIGSRISANPSLYRDDVENILETLGDLTESGSFPVSPNLKDISDWKWGGYDRIAGDLKARKDELKEKAYPEGRPKPPSF
ncbi:PD-(D/E)XK nuclease family protein [Salinibacter altiplanensis]|uniref:PD-(D/E)XK nuclease family protein n=1 Tax=Salinibacter altiplanensis TaxID=1803181 RepID=UPI000C9FF89F|nr:PD-(D/E)XK nuclease family protein [Salinibacter altiplanensis]